MKNSYESLGRDLYFKTKCTCLDKRWADSPEIAHLFPTTLRFVGYADDNFFDNVHKEAHSGACECGRKFSYQWFREGVVFNWEK